MAVYQPACLPSEPLPADPIRGPTCQPAVPPAFLPADPCSFSLRCLSTCRPCLPVYLPKSLPAYRPIDPSRAVPSRLEPTRSRYLLVVCLFAYRAYLAYLPIDQPKKKEKKKDKGKGKEVDRERERDKDRERDAKEGHLCTLLEFRRYGRWDGWG